MQEHGVLERVLLVYDETARRIELGEAVELAVVTSAANIVRRFIEEYHATFIELLLRFRLIRYPFPLACFRGRNIEKGQKLCRCFVSAV